MARPVQSAWGHRDTARDSGNSFHCSRLCVIGRLLPSGTEGFQSAWPGVFWPLFMDSFSFEALFRLPEGPVGLVLRDQRASGHGGTRVPCAPSEGGAVRDEVRVSGAQKSRVEIRACPRLSFRPPPVDAEAPRGPGLPEPRSATRSRAGGRKDGRESQRARARTGAVGPWTQRLRGSDTEPLKAGVRPRLGSSLNAATAVGNEHGPSTRDPGQTFAGWYVHLPK